MVKKVFIDTNVWLRFLLEDEKDQFTFSRRLIGLVEEGKVKPYTSAVVFLEINYVLTKVYGIPPKKVNEIIKGILSTRNLVIINKTDFKKAFDWHQKYKIKLSDCLIASSIPSNCALITWDKELTKFEFLQVLSPKGISSLKTTSRKPISLPNSS